MLFLHRGFLACGLFSLIAASPLNIKRNVNIDSATCDQTKTDIINAELPNAQAVASTAQASLTAADQYFAAFFPISVQFLIEDIKEVYGSISNVAGGSTEYTLKITCDNSEKACTDGAIAATSPPTGVTNLCDKFFDTSQKGPTDAMLTQCRQEGAPACMHLQELKSLRVFTLVHEITHIDYAMKSIYGDESGVSLDFAYNVADCLTLMTGDFNRATASYADPKIVLCPDKTGKEGDCDEDMALFNADTYAFVATGIYFTINCNGPIPISPPATSRAKFVRADNCPALTLLPDDNNADDEPPIEDVTSVLAALDSLMSGAPSLTASISSVATTTLGLIYNGAPGAPEFQTTVVDGSTVTYSYSYHIMGSPGSEVLAEEAVTVTNPAEVSGSRTAIIYETTVSGIDTTVVAFGTTASPSPPAGPAISAATPTSYPCYNYAAPDQGGSDFCTCNNGATAPVVSATGTNTGDAYMPCPYTVAPELPPPPPTTTQPGNNLYPFVTTLTGGDQTIVEECQSSSTAYYGGAAEVMCAGNVVTLSAPPSKPSVSVKVGQNQVLVGSLTGMPLYTSISSALETLCPAPTSGQPMVVPSGTATIKGIVWVNQDLELVSDGELTLSIDSGNYSDPGIRSAMIKAAANSFMASASGSNCWNETWENTQPREAPVAEKQPLCNAANFAGVDYYGSLPNGAPSTKTQWLYPHIDFGISAGSFDCAGFIEALDAVLVLIAPEFAIGETEIGEAIVAICQAAVD